MADNARQLVLKPQINISRSSFIRIWLLFGLALLAVVQSAVSDSGASFAIAFSALVGAVMSELLMTSARHGLAKLKDGSAVVTALVLTLLLPNQIHPLFAALGAAFAIIAVKHSFGGIGSNWMNPAIGGWLFIRFSWASAFNSALAETPGYITGFEGSIDSVIRTFLNRYVFSAFGSELPGGYIDLFTSTSPGIIADRAVLALIISSLIIAAFKISRLWMSFLYITLLSLLVKTFAGLGAGGILWDGDIMLNLFSGGTLVAAFILITEPSSSAKSTWGNVAVTFLAAAFSFLFRYFGNSLYGCIYAVALVNSLTPLIRRIEHHYLYSSRMPAKNTVGGRN